MSFRNTDTHYGTFGVAVHWLMAVLLIAAFVIGQRMEDMPRGPDKLQTVGYHALLGMTALLFALARLAWRRLDPAPEMPDGMPKWEILAAKAVHGALYLAMLLLPLSGVMILATLPEPVPVLGLFQVPVLIASQGAHEAFEGLHGALAKVLLFGFWLHVAATLWHWYLRRDGVAGRMIPHLRRG